MEREKKDAAVGDGQGGRGGRQRPARRPRAGDGEEGKSRDRRYEPGRGGQHVDAREQTRGIRTDVIELAAGETVVVASEIAGPHASRGGRLARGGMRAPHERVFQRGKPKVEMSEDSLHVRPVGP